MIPRLNPVILALCLLAGPAPLVAQEPVSAADQEALALAREIEKKVAETRTLEIREPTAVGVYGETELRAYLRHKVDQQLTPEVVDAGVRAMVLLGLYERGVDLVGSMMALLEGQVAGFYEPEEKKLFVIDRKSAEGADALVGMDRIIMAHELVHALQDQHFDLKGLLESVTDNDDAVSARRALVEGDATWAMLAFESGIGMARFSIKLMPDDMKGFRDLIEKAKKSGMGKMLEGSLAGLAGIDAAPAVDVDELIFAYYGGAKFCMHLLSGDDPTKADVSRLDAAFAAPPLSTEQVMHPHKYDQDRDDPTGLELPDLGPVLGEGWTRLCENTLGELRLRSLLTGAGFDAERIRRAHAGWDGDRYAVWTRPGEADVLVWASAWDSEKDELEFAACAVESVLADPGGEPGTWSRTGGRRDWHRDSFGLTSALRVGAERGVYLVHQAPAHLREELLNALEKGTKWSETGTTAEDR